MGARPAGRARTAATAVVPGLRFGGRTAHRPGRLVEDGGGEPGVVRPGPPVEVGAAHRGPDVVDGAQTSAGTWTGRPAAFSGASPEGRATIAVLDVSGGTQCMRVRSRALVSGAAAMATAETSSMTTT